MPVGIGTIISAGASIFGSIAGSGAQASGASGANAANQKAIEEAKKRAETGYGTNKETITKTGAESQGFLNQGRERAVNAFDPMIKQGDQARTYFGNATGLNGEDARNQYYQTLMNRPEMLGGRQLAMEQTQQQYGSKLGSGAFARSLQDRDRKYAADGIDRDLSRVKPLMDAGNAARGTMGQLEMAHGNNSATNSWKTGGAFINNENKFTDNMMNAALASGASNARNARDQGNAQAGMYSGIANAFGSFGGGGGGGFGGGQTGGGQGNFSSWQATPSNFFGNM